MQLAYRHFVWRYALAHYGKSLFWYASELLFPFYLTEIGLFSGRIMSLVIGASLLFSVLADLAIGWLSRHYLSNARRAGGCQIVGASLSVVSIIGFFACVWMPAAWRIEYAMAALVCFRVNYALYDIAQDVLVNLVTKGRIQRSHLTGVHFSFSGIASMTVAMLMTPMVTMHADGAYAKFFMLMVFVSLGALASSSQLGGYLRRSEANSNVSARESNSQQDTATPMFYFAVTFLLSLCGSIFVKIAPYYSTYAMHDRYAGSIMVSLYSLGIASAFPLLASIMRRMPRMQIMLRAALFIVVISAIIMSLGWVGAYVLYGGAFALGVSWSILGILCWSGFADAISRNQACQVSFDYAKFLASSKAGLLIGVALLGTMLSSLDYKHAQASYLMPLMATPSIIAGVVLLLVCLRHRQTARVSRVNRFWRGEAVVENHAKRSWVSTTMRQNLSSDSAR